MNPVYSSVIGVVLASFRALDWRVHVSGVDHIPAAGPGVVATNHVSYLDFIFAGYGVREQDKRRLRFVAKKEVFDHPVGGPLMRGMKHLPVDRDGDPEEIMEESQRRLEQGQIIGMFPEGTISRSFVPAAGRTGTARMAMRAGVPLIPCGLWGTQRLWTKGRERSFTRGVEVLIAYGPPIGYERDEDPRDVTKRLMSAIRELVVELQADYSQAPRSEDDRWWLPAHLGGTAPTPEEAAAEARAAAAARRERRAARRRGTGPDERAPDE